MALTVTLATLRTEVRRQTDTENDTHVVDAEIDSWINKGVRVFHGQLQRTDPDMFITTTTLTTVASTLEYDFTDGTRFSPTAGDFRAIRSIDYSEGGQTFTLRSFAFEERNQRGPLVAGRGDIPRYRVARNSTDGTGARLLFDIDPGSRAYSMHYLPTPSTLAADGDLLDGVMGFEDYVIAYAAKRVHLKSDEMDKAGYCEAEMQRVLRDIRILGADRHADGQERIARTRRKVRRGYHTHEYGEF